MKKRVKGLISWWLALVMLFSTLATPAMALPSNRIYIYAGTEPLKANDELYPYVRVEASEDTQLSSLVPLEDGVTLTGWNLWKFDSIGSGYVVSEKIMTHGNQFAKTIFDVKLNGENARTHVTSRSVATENSEQYFASKIFGNSKCFAHSECDAIIKDNAKVVATPEITANNVDANLIHEAAIGKIAGEQLTKLMTLGLSEKEAEEEIIKGFLR